MVRIGLLLYLILSAVVGRSLCCCLPSDLLGICNPAKQSASACHRCCADHAAHHDSRPITSKQAPRSSAPSPERDCPRKQDQAQPVALASSEKVSASEGTRSLMVPHWAMVGILVLGAVPLGQKQMATRSICCPFRNSRDILRALHILRC